MNLAHTYIEQQNKIIQVNFRRRTATHKRPIKKFTMCF